MKIEGTNAVAKLPKRETISPIDGQRPLWLKLIVAIAAVLVAALVRLVLNHWLEPGRGFLTLSGAVAVAVWFGGWVPGTFAAVLGFGLMTYLFPARAGFLAHDPATLAAAAGYAVSNGLIICLGEAMRRARLQAQREAADRRVTEEALRESEERFRSIADAAPVLMWQSGPDGKCHWFNQGWYAFTGKSAAEEADEGWKDGVHTDDRANVLQTAAVAFDKREAFQMEYRLRRHDGEYRWILNHGVPVYDSSKEFTGFIGSCVDVTAHREVEQTLQARRTELQDIINRTPFMLSRCTRDLRFLFISRAYGKMIGREPEEVAGKSIRAIMGQEGFNAIAPHIEKVLEGEQVEYEQDVPFEGVGTRRLHVIYTPDRNEKNEVVGWFGSIVDRTDPARAEEALRKNARQQEALYGFASELQRTRTFDDIHAAALNAITSGLECDRASILLFDEKSVMRFVAARGLSEGYRKAVEGHSPWSSEAENPEPISMPDIDKADLEEPLRKIIKSEGISALAFIPLVSNGNVIGKFMGYFDQPHTFTTSELETGLTIGRQLAFAIDRQRAEEKLRDSEERLRLATATGKVGAWEWDIEANRISWSDSLFATHGVTRESFDPTVEGTSALVHPDDRTRVSEAINRSVKENTPYELTFRVVKPIGEIVWLFSNAVVVRENGKPVRMIGATTDITDLKRAEEALHVAKQEAEAANNAKDQFLAVLSHELRTPLTPVLMATSEMESDPRLPVPLREQLAMMRRNIELEARLIDDLLDITRIAHGKFELHREIVDVHLAINHAINITAADMLTKQIQLIKRFDAVERWCSADAARLQEVFWNILRNAVKFTPPRGKIEISTRNDERQEQIILEFSDDGIGIEAELQPRIFDTFAQGDRAMRARFGGLGLGLAISKRIIDLHGGAISVRSDGKDKGSIFTVVLKCAVQGLSRAALTGEKGEAVALGLAQILVVEDHEDTARVLTRILESSGYRVCLCHSVAEACEAASKRQFDLVISDIGLPDATGLDLMRRLRENGEITGIAISGYGTAEDVRASEAAGFAVHLTKPVDVDRLRRAIENLIGAKATDKADETEESNPRF